MIRSSLPTVLKAGMIVGLLDIGAAFIYYYVRTGKNPLAILPFIASALFGSRAFSGGTGMMVWGALLHFGIAGLFAAFFFWVVVRLPLFIKSWPVTGALYGLFVWAVMNLVVVPLSRTPRLPFNWSNALINMAILICCIGLPLAWMAHRYRGHKPGIKRTLSFSH
jgi:hypothetical protein